MITPPSFYFKVPFRRVKTPAQIDENNYITNRAVCQGDFFKKSRGKGEKSISFIGGGRKDAVLSSCLRAGRCPETGRARVEGARGERTLSFHPFCALTLADCISAEPIVLFACAAGGQEGSATALLSITAAQGRSRLGNPPSSGITSLFTLKLRPMGRNASSILDYKGPSPG